MNSSTLAALSDNLAEIVANAGQAIVAINARSRRQPSGIHWRSGIIVTSEENLRRSEEFSITIADGSQIPATLLGRDPSTDIAVLRISEPNIPSAICSEATLKVGNLVLALGRGNEGEIRAAMGAISVVTGAWRSMSGGNIDQFIRPDISMYAGLVGGALVNAAGNVVGMNTTGRGGTALTIPAVTINRVVDQLLAKGRISRGYLGLGMQPVRLPDNLKSLLNLQATGGVIVVNVESNGPADRSGVFIGDVLVAVDGKAVTDTDDVQAVLNHPEIVGKSIQVQVIRGGALVEVAVTVGEKGSRG